VGYGCSTDYDKATMSVSVVVKSVSLHSFIFDRSEFASS
jgi:hypothetical protein